MKIHISHISNKSSQINPENISLTIASGRFARGLVSESSTHFERFLASTRSRANGRS